MKALYVLAARGPQLGELFDDVEDGDQIAEARERVSQRLEQRDRLVSVVLALLFVAAAVAIKLFVPQHHPFSLPVALLLGLVYVVGSRIEFEIGPNTVVPTQIVFVPMLFLIPLPAIPLVVAACYVLGGLVDCVRNEAPFERILLALASPWFSIGPVLVLALTHGRPASLRDWPYYAAALGAQFGFDWFASLLRQWLAFALPPRSQLSSILWPAGVDAALAPIGLLAALAARNHHYAFLLVLPLLALLAVFARERKIRIDHALELGRAYRGTAMLLGDVVEADDAYTGAHSRDVVSLSLAVARRFAVAGRELRVAEFVALLHDVGKIRVPAEIINKPGALTPLERKIINQHTIIGEEMLGGVGGFLKQVGAIVRSCHERYDGGGYPDGLAGEEIPLIARIVMCCDAFSAMTTDRSYRKGMPLPHVLAELRENAGTQFDPRVVAALVAIVEANEVERVPAAVAAPLRAVSAA